MQKRTMKPGRPVGATTYEAEPAIAFGKAVRAARVARQISQEELATRAGIERSHMGKIERGQHMPSLALILRVSIALNDSAANLMTATESILYADSEG
ncbi:helix-turn-helix transcriptional regulator [Xanthomonas hydrangeae]|uniref:helix-turn-helix domain-containing protein n=1 Tax=Xanthomonas hydrangeae TaxID=2775159 RepID=UPI0019628D44